MHKPLTEQTFYIHGEGQREFKIKKCSMQNWRKWKRKMQDAIFLRFEQFGILKKLGAQPHRKQHSVKTVVKTTEPKATSKPTPIK